MFCNGISTGLSVPAQLLLSQRDVRIKSEHVIPLPKAIMAKSSLPTTLPFVLLQPHWPSCCLLNTLSMLPCMAFVPTVPSLELLFPHLLVLPHLIQILAQHRFLREASLASLLSLWNSSPGLFYSVSFALLFFSAITAMWSHYRIYYLPLLLGFMSHKSSISTVLLPIISLESKAEFGTKEALNICWTN